MRIHEITNTTINWSDKVRLGDRLIWVDAEKVRASWAKDGDFYFDGPNHPNAIGKRIDRFGDWIKRGEPVQAPEVALNDQGEIIFTNGRHRFVWMLQHGVKVLPVAVPEQYVDQVIERFGGDRFGVNGSSTFQMTEDVAALENTIIDASGFEWIEPAQDHQIDMLDGLPVFTGEEDGGEVISIGNPAISYVKFITTATGWRYMVEFQTNPTERGKGWGAKLLIYMTKNGKIIIDRSISVATASLIEKLISSGAVTGYIANLSNGEMEEYNPHDPKDRVKPMYDTTIFGIDRPVASRQIAHDKTWVLEKWHKPRAANLQKYIYRF